MDDLETKAFGDAPPPDATQEQAPPPMPDAGGETTDIVSAIGSLTEAVAAIVAIVQPAPDPTPMGAPQQAPSPGADVNGGGLENDGKEEEDFFGEEEGDEESGDEDATEDGRGGGAEEDEEEEEEDPLDRYRRAAKPRRKFHKAHRPKRVKIHYDATHATMLKAVADHLDELGDAEEVKWSKMHGASCKYHSANLRAYMKALEEASSTAGGATVPDEAEKPPTEEEQKAARDGVAKAFAPLNDLIFSITGRQVS